MSRRMSRSRPRRRRTGVLPVLAGLLVASALLRIGEGDRIAQIRGLLEAGTAYAADGVQTATDEIGEVLAALKDREAQLDAREAQIEERSRVVEAGETELANQLAEIEAAEARLREMVNKAGAASEEDVNTLAAVYENMKPEQAGPLFEKMPPEFAAGFLSMMKPATAASIMAAVSPDAAYAISVVLAGRNADLSQPE